MFRKVLVLGDIPRSAMDFNASFSEGLGAEKWFSYIALIFLGISLVSIVLKFFTWQAFVIVLLAVLAAMWNINKIHKIEQSRQQIYSNGVYVRAEVIDHFKEFVWYKSARNYGIKIKLLDGTDRILSITDNTEALWQHATLGKKILGLRDGDKYLFGEMMHCSFALR